MAFSAGSKASINVTPLIDVLLTLIIVFMVIVPKEPTGLDAAIPQPGPAPKRAAAPQLFVTINHDHGISVNGELAAPSQLEDRLRRYAQSTASPVLFLAGDRDLAYADAASVIDLARGAGISRVALSTASQ